MPNPDVIQKYQDSIFQLGHKRIAVVSAQNACETDDQKEYFSWWLSAIDDRIRLITEVLLEAEKS